MKIDYFENLDELSNFDEIQITDNLDSIDNTDPKKKKLLLIYPNISQTNKKFKNVFIKNLALSIFNKNYSFRWKSHKDAIDFVEKNFDQLKILNSTILKLSRLVIRDNKNKLFLKNYLCKKIEKYFFYLNLKDFFSKHNNTVSLQICNPDLKLIHKYLTKQDLIQNRKIIFSRKKNNLFFYIKNSIIIFLYPLFAILKSKIKVNSEQKNFKFCIRHNEFGFGINDYPKISEDWIIDDDKFHKDNALFVLEDDLSEERIKILNRKNYNYIKASYKNPVEKINIYLFFLLIFKFFPIHVIYSFIYLFSNSLNKEILFEILRNFLIWDIFSRSYKKIKYICYHNFQGSHFIRNYFLNKTGSQTYLYKHTFSENIFDKNFEKYCNTIFSYACHNYEFQMSRFGSEMSNCNKSVFEKSYISGPIFSSKKFEDYSYKKNNKNFNLGAFNTSFSPNGVNGFYEHYLYFKFLKSLINKYDLNIFFKGKYNYDLFLKNPITSTIFQELADNNNFTLVERYISPRSIINDSDLVVSMTFATPGFEALYLKKKSFFVDTNSNYKNSLIDQNTENFVSHGIDDSLKLFELYYKENSELKSIIQKNSDSIFKGSPNDPINFIKDLVVNI